MRKSKLLIIHHYGDFGGAGQMLVNTVSNLDVEKYEVHLIIPMGRLSEKLKKFPIIIHEVEFIAQFSHYYGNNYFIFDPRFIKQISQMIRQWPQIKSIVANVKPDLILLNSSTTLPMAFALRNDKAKILALIQENIHPGLLGIRKRLLWYMGFRYADGLVFISEYDLIQFGPHPKKKVMPNWVNDIPDQVPDFPQQFSILYMGGFDILKGIHILSQAMVLFDRLNFKARLIMIVDPIERVLLRSRNPWTKLQLSKLYHRVLRDLRSLKNVDVKIMDRVPDVSPLLMDASLVVFPSTQPHQARPIFEAGAYGRPILITDFECTSEFVASLGSSTVFKRNSPADLAQKLQYLACHPDEAYELGQKNREQTLCGHVNNIQVMIREIDAMLRGE